MKNSIDFEKKQRLEKAAAMEKVPLLQLDRLIKERRQHAIEQNFDAVDVMNELIRDLLAAN